MSGKQFTMSKYATKEDLYREKALYYQTQSELCEIELSRKDAQIKEALAILESGSNYEKLHVSAILEAAL